MDRKGINPIPTRTGKCPECGIDYEDILNKDGITHKENCSVGITEAREVTNRFHRTAEIAPVPPSNSSGTQEHPPEATTGQLSTDKPHYT